MRCMRTFIGEHEMLLKFTPALAGIISIGTVVTIGPKKELFGVITGVATAARKQSCGEEKRESPSPNPAELRG